jgi:hypothetical protein
LERKRSFILPWQASVIEDNDVANGEIKHSLTDMVGTPTTAEIFIILNKYINAIFLPQLLVF